jgi:hypothetical protein
MEQWTLDDIAWDKFDVSKVTPQFLSLVKAASLVEYNSGDYARYLSEVFDDDPVFQGLAYQWADEEIQHGLALRRWAELADPSFDFIKSFEVFSSGYRLPTNVQDSVRGSRTGELVARCVVEIGTSSYYTAMKNETAEPVLQEICAKIAADEYRHYKLFYTYLKRYLEKERVGRFRRLMIALGRITESEDDELAYAYYAAHYAGTDVPYEHKLFKNRYLATTYPIYHKENLAKMITMIMKTIGIRPRESISRFLSTISWACMRFRMARLRQSYSI